ncbi:hypothetical protein GCM10010304_76680 [Streptomyces roseoviolaceus]
MMAGTLLVGCAGAAAIALVPTLWLAAALAAVIGLSAGVFGSLDNALMQTAADPAYLGRVTSVVMLTMVGLAPLSYPLVVPPPEPGAPPRSSSAAAPSPAWESPSPWPPTPYGAPNCPGAAEPARPVV